MLRNPKQPRIEPLAAPHDDATAALAGLGPPIALFGVRAPLLIEHECGFAGCIDNTMRDGEAALG